MSRAVVAMAWSMEFQHARFCPLTLEQRFSTSEFCARAHQSQSVRVCPFQMWCTLQSVGEELIEPIWMQRLSREVRDVRSSWLSLLSANNDRAENMDENIKAGGKYSGSDKAVN